MVGITRYLMAHVANRWPLSFSLAPLPARIRFSHVVPIAFALRLNARHCQWCGRQSWAQHWWNRYLGCKGWGYLCDKSHIKWTSEALFGHDELMRQAVTLCGQKTSGQSIAAPCTTENLRHLLRPSAVHLLRRLLFPACLLYRVLVSFVTKLHHLGTIGHLPLSCNDIIRKSWMMYPLHWTNPKVLFGTGDEHTDFTVFLHRNWGRAFSKPCFRAKYTCRIYP